MITAEQMKTLPELFSDIEDPRRMLGQRHRLSTILGLRQERCYVVVSVTKGLPNGPNLWGKVRVLVSDVAIKMSAISFPVNMSFVKS